MEIDLHVAREQDAAIHRLLGNYVLYFRKEIGGEWYETYRGFDRQEIPHYSTQLSEAWLLQKNHPLPSVMLMKIEWLALIPAEVAFEMSKRWLKWAKELKYAS